MDRKDVLYPEHKKRLENRMKRLAECNTRKINKKHLEDYLKKIKADGTGKAQMISYLDRLIPILELVGKRNLKSLTKKDMENIFSDYRDRGYPHTALTRP